MLTQEQTKVITDTLHFFFCTKTTEVRERKGGKKGREREGGKEKEGEERRDATLLFPH